MLPKALTDLRGGILVADLAGDETTYHSRSPMFLVHDGRAHPLPDLIGALIEESGPLAPDLLDPTVARAAEDAVRRWYADRQAPVSHPGESGLSHHASAALFEGESLTLAMDGDTPVSIGDSGLLLDMLTAEDQAGIDAVTVTRHRDLDARESDLLAGEGRALAAAQVVQRRFGDCRFATSLIVSLAPRLAHRMAELCAARGLERLNERDLQPAADAIGAGALARMTLSAGRPEVMRPGTRVSLPIFTSPLGPIDLVIAQGDRAMILVELKWSRADEPSPGATLSNCLWDLVKLAGCLQERKGRCAYLVAGGPAAAFLGGHPGTEPFTHANWSVGGDELLTRYRKYLEFPDINVRLKAVPARIKTELVTPPLQGLDPDAIVVAAARVICDDPQTIPWTESAGPVTRTAADPDEAPILQAARILEDPGLAGLPILPRLLRCDERGKPVAAGRAANRGKGYVGLYLRLPAQADLVYWLYLCLPGTPAARPEAHREELGFCIWQPASAEVARGLIGPRGAMILSPAIDVGGNRRLRVWDDIPRDRGEGAGPAIAWRVRDFLAGL